MSFPIPSWVVTALFGLFVIALGIQRCSYEHDLSQLQNESNKSGERLVETTKELGVERVEKAKTKAKITRAESAKAVEQEVAHDVSSSTLVEWINARVAGGD